MISISTKVVHAIHHAQMGVDAMRPASRVMDPIPSATFAMIENVLFARTMHKAHAHHQNVQLPALPPNPVESAHAPVQTVVALLTTSVNLATLTAMPAQREVLKATRIVLNVYQVGSTQVLQLTSSVFLVVQPDLMLLEEHQIALHLDLSRSRR